MNDFRILAQKDGAPRLGFVSHALKEKRAAHIQFACDRYEMLW